MTVKATVTRATAKVAAPLALIGDNLIGKESASLARSIKGMDSRVQRYLCSEIAHIEKHRNPTRLNTFFSAVKNAGVRTIAMHAFMQHFGNIVYDSKAKLYVMRPIRDARDAEKALANAIAQTWTTFKPEQAVKQFDLEESAMHFLVTAFKAGVTADELKLAIAKIEVEAQVKARDLLKAMQDKIAKAAKVIAPATPAASVTAPVEAA